MTCMGHPVFFREKTHTGDQDSKARKRIGDTDSYYLARKWTNLSSGINEVSRMGGGG